MVSKVQTRGRGRAGKRWNSRQGGLWFSVILRPSMGAQRAGVLQILAAVAARRAVERVCGIRVWQKWPNDLVMAEGKLGGILVDTKIVAEVVSFAILGIGINVNQRPEGLPKGAVSLLGVRRRKTELLKLLAVAVRELRSDYSRLGDSSGLVSEWWDHCIHKDKIVVVNDDQPRLRGRSKGLNEQGQLLVETEQGAVVNLSEGTLRVLD